MPRLSVIVPVYNVEAYLPECIESILGQSLRDLELILIDDGSPDGCGEICDSWAARDSRVRVIHQINRGVSAARNAGLAVAQGDYVGFVDPDDWIAPECYEAMAQAAEAQLAQLAVCGFLFCRDDGSPVQEQPVPAGSYTREELLTSIYGMPNRLHGSMCNKLFARVVLEGLRFDESVAIGEDWLLLYECYCRTERGVALADCFYRVRMREHSATRSVSAQLYLRKLDAYLRLCDYAAAHPRPIRRQAAAKALDACMTNKLELRKQAEPQAALAYVNKKMRQRALRSLLRRELPVKTALYYFKEGLRG